MPHKLYVYLRGGRGDAFVTDNWDGLAPADHAGEEESEPYRDMSQTVIKVGGPAGVAVLGIEGSMVYPGSATKLYTKGFDNGAYAGGGAHVVSPMLEIEGTPNDESAGTAPRQFTKQVTWLIFEEAGDGGCVFRFRKADVIGWGKNPRL